MTENIQRIFNLNTKLLADMDKAVYHFREQQYHRALYYVANSIEEIKYVIEAIINDREYFHLVNTESMLEMLTGIVDAKKNRDFILLADLLELQLINFLISVQELIIGREEILFDEENYKDNINRLIERGIDLPISLKDTINTTQLLESGYRVEFTSCGKMTLAAENAGEKFYFHTNSRIQNEAYLLARSWYRKDLKKYTIFGLGMGYHISELSALAPEAEIEIYEPDVNVVILACAFAGLSSLLQNEKIKLIYDPEFVQLQKNITEFTQEESFFLHYPSYKNIRSMQGKELLESTFSWCKEINEY